MGDGNEVPEVEVVIPDVKTKRPWLDLHPKVAAALLVVVGLFVLAFIVGLVDPDFFLETKELLIAAIGGLLALVPAYFKSGDGK